MKLFLQNQVNEAVAYTKQGGQALHLHKFLPPNAPRPFVKAINHGENIAHLSDQDIKRLRLTAHRLGVKLVYVHPMGERGQHVDLCGAPLRKAMKECAL